MMSTIQSIIAPLKMLIAKQGVIVIISSTATPTAAAPLVVSPLVTAFKRMSFCASLRQQFDGSAAKSAIAAERNKQPILEILQKYMDPQMPLKVLEISSGTGIHVMHFAKHFPNAIFQPSELDAVSIHSINSLIDEMKLANVRVPLLIDISKPLNHWYLPEDFGVGNIDVIININMIHVSSNTAIDGLFESSGKLLKPDTGLLITYGAFAVDGQITPESNVEFDRTIRSINPEWGLRDIADIKTKAATNNLYLSKVFDMPANNKTLIFDRHKV